MYRELFDFSQKTVVVTGGLGLIGYQVSRAFLEFGASVIVADISDDRFLALQSESGGTRAQFTRFDITNVQEIADAVRRLTQEFDHIDVWVNTAYPRTPDWGNRLEDIRIESWDANVRMQLGGYFWTSKSILEHMRVHGRGSLINFGSTYGIVGPHFGVYEGTAMTMPVAYAAIKGAIVNLTRYLAVYYGRHGVRVNSICPGGVLNDQDPVFVERYGSLTPMGRMARAEEIAMPTLFLASDAASYVTGHTFMVDGGWTAW